MHVLLKLLLLSVLTVTSHCFSILPDGCITIPLNTSSTNVIPALFPAILECEFDSEPEACIWTHSEPMNEGVVSTPDVRCSAGRGESGQSCADEPRVQFQFAANKCGVVVGDTRAEDSGSWKLSAVGLNNEGTAEVANTEFKLWTYNQSTPFMLDEDDTDITGGAFNTSYNWNEENDVWEEGKEDWETVEFTCRAYGGRPFPNFLWFINDHEEVDLSLNELFRVSEQRLNCEDRYSFICNVQSTIQFTVDDRLMELMRVEFGVETNPVDELVRFGLNCLAVQEGHSSADRVAVALRVQKSYDGTAPFVR